MGVSRRIDMVKLVSNQVVFLRLLSFPCEISDGIGDLPGILSKLDYVKSIGVDAVWISPFYRSPNKDQGYDISDYRKLSACSACETNGG